MEIAYFVGTILIIFLLAWWFDDGNGGITCEHCGGKLYQCDWDVMDIKMKCQKCGRAEWYVRGI